MNGKIEATTKVIIKWYRTRTPTEEIRKLKRYVKTHSHTNREFSTLSRRHERNMENLRGQIGTLGDKVNEYEQRVIPELRERVEQTQQDRDKYLKKTGTLEEKVENLEEKLEETKQERDLYEEAFEKSTTTGENFAEKIYENSEKTLKILDDNPV